MHEQAISYRFDLYADKKLVCNGKISASYTNMIAL